MASGPYTNTHTFSDESDYKKPGARQPAALGLKIFLALQLTFKTLLAFCANKYSTMSTIIILIPKDCFSPNELRNCFNICQLRFGTQPIIYHHCYDNRVILLVTIIQYIDSLQ